VLGVFEFLVPTGTKSWNRDRSAMKPASVVEHENLGKYVKISSGLQVFVRDQSPENGDARGVVVMVHGVPSSAFLYRKCFDPVTKAGFRAIAFDFPGMGLSDKPECFDYTWEGLKDAMKEIIDALEIPEKLHIVLHDIGGPIAAWFCAENIEKIASITILDTLLNVVKFRKPTPMWMFEYYGLRRFVLVTLLGSPTIWRQAMVLFGAVHNGKHFTKQDAEAWIYLLKNKNGSESFLKIMAGFVQTQELEDTIVNGLQEVPIQIVWGKHETSISKSQLKFIQAKFPVKQTNFVSGGHFLQEDCFEDLSKHITEFVASSL